MTFYCGLLGPPELSMHKICVCEPIPDYIVSVHSPTVLARASPSLLASSGRLPSLGSRVLKEDGLGPAGCGAGEYAGAGGEHTLQEVRPTPQHVQPGVLCCTGHGGEGGV